MDVARDMISLNQMDTKIKKIQRDRRRKRVRAKVFGDVSKPRLSVFRSNKYIYAQVINDTNGTTIASANSKEIKGKNVAEKATAVGESIAKQVLAKKIEKVVFDRGGYLYTGSISAVALGARNAGLKF